MTGPTVLARKLGRVSTARSPLPSTDILGQAFTRGLEKHLRPLVKANVGALPREARVMKVRDAIGNIAVPAMLSVFSGERGGPRGLLAAGADLCFHLIDLMLCGDPAAAPAPVARAFTAIDVALCELAQSAILAALTDGLAASVGRALPGGFAIAAPHQDVTQLRFAPANGDVLVLDVTLDIGTAGRAGTLRALLPLALLDSVCAAARAAAPAAPAEEPDDLWGTRMRRAAASAPVRLAGVLHTTRMTIDEVMRLRPGAVIEIPAEAPGRLRLMMNQRGGRRIALAAGALGTHGESKAARLTEPPDPRLAEQLRATLGLPAADPPALPARRGEP
ncbi:FliM/FliN family flagellar motor switch protein [Amaricoccus solimangrovi]|uniref:Flagellar motor switch protein FliM n=1 Tax=Amaricoccus solimangrovi TaxID=2589815 RepID=A0A501WXP3_9RHOB|nr:FliM/FliN family flagellar motor switch protein [Amaricoccus solimangrovi]TPE51741.1 hypothetical protein FJM51_08600 [Amaricoccus solimangrovi]